jgi:hypothetical protein
MRLLPALLCWVLLSFLAAAAQIDHADRIASLIDAAKLATLGERGAKPRSCRCAPPGLIAVALGFDLENGVEPGLGHHRRPRRVI